MNGLSFSFAPLFPWWVVALIASAAALLALYGIVRGLRGAWIRFAALVLLTLALANPSLLQEDREALKTVVAVVVDETDSQKFDGREAQTAAAAEALEARLARFPNLDVRRITARNGGAEEGDASSALFTALERGLQDVPPDQVGGAILLSDGQVHDVPEDGTIKAPVHALITGSENDRDRRISITKAPRFGIVGEAQELIYQVTDTNIESDGGLVSVRVSIDGEMFSTEQVLPGEETSFFFDVPHGGRNVIELQVESVEGELTTVNNQAFAVLDGIRENLRVLLISGEPHAGERTWRNLLKSDASVDLVHFTILRPPEKQDGTPITQLSLIAFPTRELFIEKIDEFDLIIFDRYQRRGVLPVLYFDNIARYVQDGGAVLIAAGPEHAGFGSVAATPLETILPVRANGEIIEAPFRADVSAAGRRHPVTRGLPGLAEKAEEANNWGRWFRQIDGTALRGDTIMQANGDRPLLTLDRPGEGRVALLMSDHVWLWARGFEGGGPHTQLLRRLGHWLMKEPELDEEALRADADGNIITFKRQTMGDEPGQLNLITPDGQNLSLDLVDQGDGTFEARHEADTLGLYRAANGDKTALVHVGPTNPREYNEIVSTFDKLAPALAATGGRGFRVEKDSPTALPRIVTTRGTGATGGRDWIGIRTTQASVLKGISQIPLFAGFLGLGILLLAMAGMWAREGR
ncbi:MAG: hypothetical protein AAGK38_06085 [Pseudomonadota bacterium]